MTTLDCTDLIVLFYSSFLYFLLKMSQNRIPIFVYDQFEIIL